MRSWLTAVLCLCVLSPAFGEEREGGLKHHLKITKGLRYTDNPAFDMQGDPRWARLASLDYEMSSETRRQKLTFNLRGDAIGSRVARADARLAYRVRSSSAQAELNAFLRKFDGGYLDNFPSEGRLRRLVDLSEPGRDIISYGMSGRLETGLGRKTGVVLSFRTLGRRSTGALAVPISKSRRFEANIGVVMRPSRRTVVRGEVGGLRQRFFGAAARTDRHLLGGFSVQSDLSRRLTFEGSAGWRRIRSDRGALRTTHSGLEWSLALKQARGDLTATLDVDQRQYLSGTVRSVRFGLQSTPSDQSGSPMIWHVWAGGLELPSGGHEVIYGLEASLERESSRLGLTVSRDYLAGLTDGYARVATFARMTYRHRLTSKYQLDVWAELAKVDATPAFPARRIAAVEASISTRITPAFSLRTGINMRNRKGGLAGAARDRSFFVTLERLRVARR